MSRIRVVSACAVLLGAMTGCGTRLVPVSGTVTLDDKPLANATVMFIHEDPGGRDAHGITNDKGAFTLTTQRPGDGAFPGSYKITVHHSDPSQTAGSGATSADVQKAKPKVAKPSVVLPAIYTDAGKTTLKHRIPEDGVVSLKLQSAR
jgi:hypothetical protein